MMKLRSRWPSRPIAWLLASVTMVCTLSVSASLAEDVVIADFESESYRGWTVSGEAFGDEPATGTLPNQMPVSGYRGDRLVNTFRGGDAATGEAISAEFAIERSHIAFLIGGGSDPQSLGIELHVDGRVVRSATGSASEELLWTAWDVSEFAGQRGRLRIFDSATGGWGHINVDQIIQTESPPDRFGLQARLADYRQSPHYLDEPLRPQSHFSPEINWMNDPNGLVYHDGEYHLFYQYNPAGNAWGHMSWGHAVSTDLVHWEHLPIAIPEEDGVMAFSGCCVVDHQNTSGFGKGDEPPMVAIYTGHGHGKQVQNLAYSNDNGRSWTRYENNPVIDINDPNFRDPKVFWHHPTARWVMVVSLAAEKVLIFYESANLKDWQELSRFGPAGSDDKPNWECPDLFELPIENEPGKTRWVLEVDMGGGSVAGGSGGEYFVGEFDGRQFIPTQPAQWVDYGRDFYAPISWSNIPESDGRTIWIGWLNNWQTALIPTSPWRGCMSVPRSLSLRRLPENDDPSAPRYRLVQRIVDEFSKLRTGTISLDTSDLDWPPTPVTQPGQIDDLNFVLETRFQPADARSCGIRIRTGEDEFIELGYDAMPGVVYVDRRNSGQVDFHPAFAGRHEAPVRLIDGAVTLRAVVDHSLIEVFINDGEQVISDRFFPTGQEAIIEAFVGGSSATITDTQIHLLHSIWHDQ